MKYKAENLWQKNFIIYLGLYSYMGEHVVREKPQLEGWQACLNQQREIKMFHKTCGWPNTVNAHAHNQTIVDKDFILD